MLKPEDITFELVREIGTDIRVHGNGFLQVNLPDNQRVHLFGHPDLPRQAVPTPVHDHTWGFESRILCGLLINLVWGFSEDEFGGPHTHYVCKYEPTVGEDTRLIPIEQHTGYLTLLARGCFRADGSYTHYRGVLHETFSNEPTITLMTKNDMPDEGEVVPAPRVLCRIGKEPDNSFTRYDLDESQLWAILKDAFTFVQRVATD